MPGGPGKTADDACDAWLGEHGRLSVTPWEASRAIDAPGWHGLVAPSAAPFCGGKKYWSDGNGCRRGPKQCLGCSPGVEERRLHENSSTKLETIPRSPRLARALRNAECGGRC